MRLIDADETIKELTRQRDKYESHDWINLKESLINDGYDFAITDVEHMPTVDAIPKADYEARLKAMLGELLKEVNGLRIDNILSEDEEDINRGIEMAADVIQEKINSLKENTDGTN